MCWSVFAVGNIFVGYNVLAAVSGFTNPGAIQRMLQTSPGGFLRLRKVAQRDTGQTHGKFRLAQAEADTTGERCTEAEAKWKAVEQY